MIEGIIYKYTSPSGKCYIGQTTNEKIRREHWNTPGPYAGLKIDRARIKYGILNFTYEVLIRNTYNTKEEAREDLNRLEIYYIGIYNSYEQGYNCTIGGDTTLGYICTKETRDKISKGNTGKKRTDETKKKLSDIRKGRKFSSTHKTNLSKALKGRKCTWRDKIIASKPTKVVIQYNTDGTYLNKYDSVMEASNKTKVKMCNIYKCLSGKNRTAGGFIWKYGEDLV